MKKTINIKWPLIGNDHIFKFLDKQIREKNPAQVYIFSGISNVGKTKTATHFAKSLLCLQEPQEVPCDQCLSCLNITRERNNHSDLYYLKREDDKKNISIEQVRDFIHKISLSSFQNGFKIGIIKNAHYLNINGHNALLKTLEEPNKKVVIILTTSNIDQIPNTVLSRSQVLRFRPVDQNLINNLLISQYKAEKSEAKNLSRMCLGRPAIAIKLKEDTEYYDKYSENINTFVFLNMNDINLRFNKIEEIITKKQTPQESSRLVSKLLEAWLALTRDCLLIKYSQKNLVQHSIIIEQLENIEKKFTVQQLLNLNNILINAKMYLRSNVNSKNILEYIAVNI